MDRDYAQRYRQLYAEHWWWRSREAIIESSLFPLYSDSVALNILDIGCGDGLFFPRLRKLGAIDGVEPNPDLVSDSGRALGRIFVQPFDDTFQPDRLYDLIIMLDVVEHVNDDAAFLMRAKSMLAPNGRVVVTVPAFQSLWTSHDDFNHHYRRYTKQTITLLAEKCGLHIERWSYLFAWVAVAKLLVKAKELIAGKSAESAKIPNSFINHSLIKLTMLEFRLLSHIGFPLGSSLFVILK